jgi:hypothetical protein
MIRTLSFASILALALGACATNQGPLEPGNDELAGEAGDGDAAKADAAHDTFGYLAVHKVANVTNPLFGVAYNVQRANRSTTMCQDQAYHAQCGVHAMMWESMGLSQTQVDKIEAALQREIDDPSVGTQVIVKGSYKILVDFSGFEPTEVWLAQLDGGNDSGTFVQVFDYHPTCKPIMACPQLQEFKLNSTKQADIEELDFGSASDSIQNKVADATSANGAIVVGDRETRSLVDFINTLRSVNQVYLPIN